MTVEVGVLVAGRYRVEAPAGAGGMGVVWRARDERDDRAVALKRAHESNDEAVLRRTQREARAAALVAHERVVDVYDVLVEEGVCWLVMEFVPGRDLSKIINEDGPLPAAKAARIGRQVAEALEALHGAGLVHGDVAPGNVLVTEEWDAKLTDFGAARRIWGDVTVTESDTALGTAPYLSPEVARGENKVPASDVFSLGATLYWAVEGVSPLGTADNPRTFAWRAGTGIISSPRVRGPLGPALSALLAVAPADRPDAARVKEMLAAAETETGTGRDPETPVADPPPRRYVRLVVGGVAVAALIAAGVIIIPRLTGGTATPPSATGTPAAAGTVGDARTADPCGLLNAADYQRFGSPQLAAESGNFDQCDVAIETSGGDDLADVQVDMDTGPWPPAARGDRTTRAGVVRIRKHPSGSSDECDRALLLPDKNLVYIKATRDGPGAMNLCRAADIAATQAARVLNQGPVPRRVASPAAKSLARFDACKLLPGSDLAQVPGLRGAAPSAGLGNWQCDWSGRSGLPDVLVYYDRSSPLSAGQDGQAAQVAGRAAFVQPGDDGPDTCVVRAVYRHFQHSDGEPAEELVDLEVQGKGGMDERCGQAKQLLGAAMARLPRT